MSKRSFEDQVAEFLTGIVVGIGAGFLFGVSDAIRKKRRKTQLSYPNTLEYGYTQRVFVPVSERPWYTRIKFSNPLVLMLLLYTPWAIWVGVPTMFEGTFTGGLCLLTSGFGLAFLFTMSLLRRNQYDQPAEVAEITRPIDMDAATAYSVSVPNSTKWDATKAANFMKQILLKTGGRMTFQIVAEHGQIAWRLLDLRAATHADIIQSAVNAIYPEAEVNLVEVQQASGAPPFSRYIQPFQELNIDLPFPSMRVQELKDFDPLNSLTHEMSNLREGERVIYTLVVADDARFVYDQLEDLITRSTDPGALRRQLGLLVDPGGSAYAMVNPSDERAPVYVDHEQKALEEKGQKALYQGLLLMQIDAPSPERVLQIRTIASHILEFGHDDYNGMLLYEEPLPERIQQITSATQAEQTDILARLNSYFTNQSTQWQNFRLLLDTDELAALWHLPNADFSAPGINWANFYGPAMPRGLRAADGIFVGHSRSHEVRFPLEDRATHTVIIGKNGTGKSSLMHQMIHEDIRSGRGLCVIDPHGSLIAQILSASIPDERMDDVVVLDLSNYVAGVYYPPPFNLLYKTKSGKLSPALRDIMRRVYRDFAGTQMEYLLEIALETLANKAKPTLMDIERLFTDPVFREGLLQQSASFSLRNKWSRFINKSARQQEEATFPLLRRLDGFIGDDQAMAVTCHPDTLDIAQLIAANKIMLVNVGAAGNTIAKPERLVLGSSIVSRMEGAAMDGAVTSEPYLLYIDEAQDFVTTPLDTMLSGVRKFGLGLVLANQYWGQLAGQAQEAVFGNVGTLVSFEIGHDDARAMSNYMTTFTRDQLTSLGKYKAAVSLRHEDDRVPAFLLETNAPPGDKSDTASGQERAQLIRKHSVQNYTPKSYDAVIGWLQDQYVDKDKASPDINHGDDDIWYDDDITE